ncbi:MAG: hypothetical protein JXR97_15630 [Planctomycetes bacterium]|nr:hypothetical protein [Planctomycetota bacterium]
MKVKSLFWIGTMAIASMLSPGCGSDTVGSVGKFFSKPFAATDKSSTAAESADVDAGAVASAADSDESGKLSQTAGSNYNNPGKPDVAFVGGALDEEYESLKARQKLEEQRLSDYREKSLELAKLMHEYESRHNSTTQRIKTLEKIRKMLNEDPSMLNKLGEDDGKFVASKTPAPAIKDDILNMDGSSGWAPSDVKGDGKSTPAFTPALSMDGDSGSFFSAPPAAKKSGPVDLVSSSSLLKKDSDTTDVKVLKASVLAMDGEGADSTIILGAGERDGVSKGMLFGSGSGKGQTVLVVTKVFPTYCRAMPHPKFGAVNVGVREKVQQLPALPQ